MRVSSNKESTDFLVFTEYMEFVVRTLGFWSKLQTLSKELFSQEGKHFFRPPNGTTPEEVLASLLNLPQWRSTIHCGQWRISFNDEQERDNHHKISRLRCHHDRQRNGRVDGRFFVQYDVDARFTVISISESPSLMKCWRKCKVQVFEICSNYGILWRNWRIRSPTAGVGRPIVNLWCPNTRRPGANSSSVRWPTPGESMPGIVRLVA